jgi:membrane-associated phospholipid phosphatase
MGALDDRLFARVNDFARATPWLHGVAVGWARYGIVAFAVMIGIALWLSRTTGPRVTAAAIWTAVGALIALAVNQPLGDAVHEARPYATHPGVLVLVPRTADFSFPSDHAVVAGAVATGLLIADVRLGAAAAALALVMGADRVYVGAHYPADVVAGLALGSAVVVVGWLAIGRPLTLLAARLRRGRLRPVLVSVRHSSRHHEHR